MFTSHHHELEVEAEAREQAKLDGMRARRAERVDRLMNARERTSGRDDAAREWQVAEREKKLAQEAEERKRDCKCCIRPLAWEAGRNMCGRLSRCRCFDCCSFVACTQPVCTATSP